MKKTIICMLSVLLLATVTWIFAATAGVSMNISITDLGETSIILTKDFTASTPDAYARQYRQLESADTAEVLDLGDVSTIEGILLLADDNDIIIDCNYSGSFDEDIIVPAGQCTYFKPTGTVRVMNEDAGETPLYEYIVFGTR